MCFLNTAVVLCIQSLDCIAEIMAYRRWSILGAIAYFKAIVPDALVNKVLECMAENLDGYKGLDMSAQGDCDSSYIVLRKGLGPGPALYERNSGKVPNDLINQIRRLQNIVVLCHLNGQEWAEVSSMEQI